MPDTIQLDICRQDGPGLPQYWQSFRIPYRPRLNVISALMEIRRNPVDLEGNRAEPVVWDASCLEEVCGSCAMIINHQPRAACSALIDDLEQPIRIEPLTKFPVVRDLLVDRRLLFDGLKASMAWVDIGNTDSDDEPPKIDPELQQVLYKYSQCITCGLCLEVCPQVKPGSPFVGPSTLMQVYYFNQQPLGAPDQEERVKALEAAGGVDYCSDDQSCAKVCPKGIPLLDAISGLKQANAWGWFTDD